MGLIKSILAFIQTRGTSNLDQATAKLVGLINVISCLTALGAFATYFVATYLYHDGVYAGMTLFITVTYLMVPVFHHFDLVKFTKYYFGIAAPIWCFLSILFIGGFFSQSLVVVANMFITFLIFKDESEVWNGFFWYNLLTFVVATIYISFNGPLFGVRNYWFDEVWVFLFCLLWMSILFSVYKSENKQHIETLKARNEELRSKTIEIERFSYLAAHDLRSPLISISSFMDIIKRDISNGEHQNIAKYAEIASEGAAQMEALLDGIQEISDLNRRTEKSVKLVDLNDPLNKAIKNIQSDITAKKAVIHTQDLPKVYCLESDFVIIFQNLIQNGIKYNDKSEPHVEIFHSNENNKFNILVRDNGIGIPHKYKDQIFEFFKRLHGRDKYAGTGLGLGICKKLVDEMKGEIGVESQEGVFTEFCLSFPNDIMKVDS